jgi:hypothetical protein
VAPVEIVDEAFAHLSLFTAEDESVESTSKQCAPRGQAIDHQLLFELTTQLRALDRQRNQLARLLESIGTGPSSR